MPEGSNYGDLELFVAVLIAVLERAKSVEVLLREHSTTLTALESAFRSASPKSDALYRLHRRDIEIRQLEHPASDPVDLIQSLIDRLRGLPPSDKPRPN
jgi:hypothetical protein